MTTFTIQQLLVISLVIFSFLISNFVVQFYNLNAEGVWLFRSLLFAFFLSSLKTIPSVILERRLDFQTLIVPQILENLAFYTVAVMLAWQGMGITSFTWAVIVRAIIGVVSIYLLAPWPISVGFSHSVARKLLNFGLPFQANSFLALLKDDLLTVFLGKILPFGEVGYLGWAKKWAEVPLRLFMDSVVRVTFPAFARIQESKEILGKAIERTLFGLSLLIFPITVFLLFFVEPMVSLMPRYAKWEPALTSFYYLAIASAISSLSVPLTNALSAAGKIKITLNLMVMWTILTWILVIAFISLWGYQGFALALLVITITIIIVVFLAKRVAPFSFLASTYAPFLGALVLTLWFYFTRGVSPYFLPRLILSATGGAILYGVFVYLVQKDKVTQIINQFKNA